MRIVGRYSFNGGEEALKTYYAMELAEVERALAAVDSAACKTKRREANLLPGQASYSRRALHQALRKQFRMLEWKNHRVACNYSKEYYEPGYQTGETFKAAFREMDFVKNRVGIEIQFGKYVLMVYDVCAKMTIFHNLGLIDVGIEIVPVKEFVKDMSSGVSYFEQFVWDLQQRGVADIDIPVLILGIAQD